MKKKKLYTMIVHLLLCSLLLSSCKLYEDEYSGEIFAMDTLISLTVWGKDANQAIIDCERYLYQLEEQFSATRSGSEVSLLNEIAPQWQRLSPEVAEVLCFSLKMYDVTEGAFDATIYPLTKAWGFTLNQQQVPSPETIETILPLVDSSVVEFREETQEARLEEGMELDFGGITKGYAGDMLAEKLRDDGYSSALISLGGNIYALGKKTDGALWNIGIQNPYGGGAIVSVQVEDKAVVTSGGYQRYFTEGEEIYWHILNPDTGYPAKTGLASVTIVSDSAMYGDCLSTALFVMGLDKAIAFWQEHQDFEVVFITEDYEIYVSSGLSYSVATGYEAKVIAP